MPLTHSGLTNAFSKLRAELVVWQIGTAFALFGALKFIH
jgi:hypothetical protein